MVGTERGIHYLHAGGLRIIGHLTQTDPAKKKWNHQSAQKQLNLEGVLHC